VSGLDVVAAEQLLGYSSYDDKAVLKGYVLQCSSILMGSARAGVS